MDYRRNLVPFIVHLCVRLGKKMLISETVVAHVDACGGASVHTKTAL